VANDYFLKRQYDDAKKVLEEIIRLNAETYDAWTLLGTIFDELGDRPKALQAMMAAAHMMPKVTGVWMNAAAYCLQGLDELGGGDEEEWDVEDELELFERREKKKKIFSEARMLYGAAVRADGTNVEARTQLADVCMQLGHAGSAVTQYTRVLELKPLNIRTVRNLADGALDAKDKVKTGAKAREAYRRIIEHCMANDTTVVEEGEFEWSDLRIYLEFFAVTEEWEQASRELKEVSRFLLGRKDETIWQEWHEDDREWDVGEDRRAMMPGYVGGRYPFESYGLGLPVDLRAKLCVYRLKMGHVSEAMLHMEVLDPKDKSPAHNQEAMWRFKAFPDCLKDVGAELLAQNMPNDALDYFDLYRQIAADDDELFIDADFLVNLGRAYLASGNKVAAEESFIGALEEDEFHINARFELAKLYEAESEKEGREEAFLLVNEALNLEAQQRRAELLQDRSALLGKPRRKHNRRPADPDAPRAPRKPRVPGEKRKYRPRRFQNPEERQRQELQRKTEMLSKYRTCVELRSEMGTGDKEAVHRWMAAAKDLYEDFKSSKQFFSWEKYVGLRGFAPILGDGGNDQDKNSKLAAMAARLQQSKCLPPSFCGGWLADQTTQISLLLKPTANNLTSAPTTTASPWKTGSTSSSNTAST
jgi:general transcription factor 3C polypeptide 3 (transcription factor C subunit 4)